MCIFALSYERMSKSRSENLKKPIIHKFLFFAIKKNVYIEDLKIFKDLYSPYFCLAKALYIFFRHFID